MTDAEREELIRASINACLSKGIKLGIQSWGIDWIKSKNKWAPRKDNTCCALSCVLLVNQDKLHQNEISWRDFSLEKLLEANTSWIRSFQYGFDGWQKVRFDEKDAYVLGELIRKELVK